MIQTFQYKQAKPNIPFLKEHLEKSNNKEVVDGSELEIEVLLSEKELYRYYLKYFMIKKSNKKSICISVFHSI